MEFTREHIISIIRESINQDKKSVLIVVNNSYISVKNDISDENLLRLIIRNIEEGNGYLIYNLTSYLDEKSDTKEYSNWITAVVSGVIALGKGIYGLVKSKKAKTKAKKEAALAAKKDALTIRLAKASASYQKNLIAIANERESASITDSDKSRVNRIKRNTIILSASGITLLLSGGIYLLLKK